MYAYYLEGYSNGIRVTHTIQARTKEILEKRTKAYHVKNRVANVGWVLYTFNPNTELKYNKANYTIVAQYNAKAFFEYW